MTVRYVRLNRDRLKGSSGEQEALLGLNVLFEVLLTMSQIMSPFTPFFAEYLYQNLRKLQPLYENSDDSVPIDSTGAPINITITPHRGSNTPLLKGVYLCVLSERHTPSACSSSALTSIYNEYSTRCFCYIGKSASVHYLMLPEIDQTRLDPRAEARFKTLQQAVSPELPPSAAHSFPLYSSLYSLLQHCEFDLRSLQH